MKTKARGGASFASSSSSWSFEEAVVSRPWLAALGTLVAATLPLLLTLHRGPKVAAWLRFRARQLKGAVWVADVQGGGGGGRVRWLGALPLVGCVLGAAALDAAANTLSTLLFARLLLSFVPSTGGAGRRTFAALLPR